jgi:hypothetical protein
MPNVSTEKARDFMWAVQTGIIAYAGSVRRADKNREQVAEYSGSGVFIVMDEAVRAAGLIPDEKSASEAASEFVQFWADRKNRDRNPGWFTRYGVESFSYSHLSKAEQFLWIVQTVIVCDQENQADADPEENHPERHDPARALRAARAAILSANHIPPNVDVTEAANDFVSHFAMREKHKSPSWAKEPS